LQREEYIDTPVERPLVPDDLGIETGRLAQLRGSLRIEGEKVVVFVDMIEGRGRLTVGEIRGVLPSLIDQAREMGATMLRVEAIIANEELFNLARRVGFQTAGRIEFLELTVP